MKITKSQLKQMITESVLSVINNMDIERTKKTTNEHRQIRNRMKPLNEGGKWIGDFKRESVSELGQRISQSFKKGEESVSFSLNGMDFTIRVKDGWFFYSSGEKLKNGDGRSKTIKETLKYCWQLSQQK